ncbi:TIGR02594 family protein [Rhodopseudomonas palustris]|uniref:NlpC/P60 family protein n=1 Tax=Rhodopseudomonas TaxID=1073 RepID=UPI0021F2BA96|nr:TIGR02594 family protein [Rhodopseudomonas palustris]UYO44058.1 TIGR02594 family protein [Rhodopseudomonas palustris]
MVVFSAFGLFRFVAAALSFVALAAIAAPASAKPLHRHHAHASSYSHHSASRHAHHHRRSHAWRRHGRIAQQQAEVAPSAFGFPANDPAMDVSAAMAQPQLQPATQKRTSRRQRLAAQQQDFQTQSWNGGGTGSSLVEAARSYIGSGNPTGRRALWCARFMNMVLERTGHQGTGSDMASSFARYGQRISGPQVGAIAVMSRGKRGGHVGVVSGIDANGNPIVVSGNHSHRVAESVYSKSRIYAYVMPSS